MKKIMISGQIGFDVMPADFSAQIDAAKGEDLDIKIASPGGSVYHGLEIYNAIRDYKRSFPNAQIMATVSGLAASMASYIAMNPAIDLLTAEDNAVFMIHNVWGVSVGDYREMLKTADVFQGLSGILAQSYSRKTGKKQNEIQSMMDEETWFFGDEIKAAGFVDEMIKTDEKKEKASAVAESKAKLKMLSEKLEKQPVENQKIAAMLRPEPIENSLSAGAPVNNTTPAQSTREKSEEVSDMTLDQILSEHPAAKFELEARMQAHGEEQFKAGKASHQKVMDAASLYLAPGSAYGNTIRAIAVDVVKGAKSLEALETTVAAFDALKESNASATASTESAEIGDTAGQQVPESPDGDFSALLAGDKSSYGLEVR